MTKWMTLDQKFIWPSYIDKNDNKLLFDSYSEAWLNSVLLLLSVFSPGRGLAGFPQEKLKWPIKTRKMRPLGRRGKLRVKRT